MNVSSWLSTAKRTLWRNSLKTSSPMWPKLRPSLRLDSTSWDKDEMLLLVDEIKNVLFTSERRMEGEINTASVDVASDCRAYDEPKHNHGHKLQVVTERMRSRIPVAEMCFRHRRFGFSLGDRVRSSVIQEGLKVGPLFVGSDGSQK